MTELKNVLIIEDNASDADLIMEILDESENYFLADNFEFQTAWVKSLDEAKEEIQNQNFDIVLSDLNLRDSVGLNTLSEIKKILPNSILIVLTGFINRKLWAEALANGADDYITKNTLEGNILVRSICYTIERHKYKDLAVSQ